MARAYSGVLGALALSFCILRGLILGFEPDDILSSALLSYAVFAFLGFAIGFIADKTICESVETRFRNEMARLVATADRTTNEQS